MKKIVSILFFAVMIALVMPVFASEDAIEISIGGETLVFSDAKPFIDNNNRTLVPIGALAEKLNLEIEWDSTTETACIKDSNGVIIKITIGENKIYNGDKAVIMDTAAVLKQDRVFIPIRYVADILNFEIEWDEEARKVNFIPMFNVPKDKTEGFNSVLFNSMPKDKNYMVSPFSLKMALAMAANGAGGDTKNEILHALKIDDLDEFNEETNEFIEKCNENEIADFNVANSIWNNTDYFSESDVEFSDEYKEIIEIYYSGASRDINNSNGAEAINDWIAEQTKDKIKDVVNDDIVKGCMSILVNTIYFNGRWTGEFSKGGTIPDVFTDREGNTETTDFMNETSYYSYFEDDDIQMICKSFNDRNTSMYFVLPKNYNPLSETVFSDAVNSMTSRRINFSLPKFKTESMHINIIDILKNMGITTAFNPVKAEFNQMYSDIPPENMFIGQILQKTFIEVDEEGVEAAAATAIASAGGAAPVDEPIDFKCDRPFIYFIMDNDTGEVLFMGEYAYVE